MIAGWRGYFEWFPDYWIEVNEVFAGEASAGAQTFAMFGFAGGSFKGKPEALHAWVVQGLSNSSSAIIQHPRGIEGLQAPLVGRTLELALMHATYARVQAERHPHLITLLGVPGIGKSRPGGRRPSP